MSGVGKVVCVTGASGYIASWLVKLLLQRGYTVKASVRDPNDPKKTQHLVGLDGAKERLQLFKADLLEEGSFDSAIVGCHGVFHTASPVIHSANDPQGDIIEPAVKGTVNVLRSCAKASSVKRVVVTSSMIAVFENDKPLDSDVVVDETWFSDPDFCMRTKNWYAASKTLAEKAAWEFAKENKIDLVIIHPGVVFGPLIQPTINLSVKLLLEQVNGPETYPNTVLPFVDVRDVGNSHIEAFEVDSANGRYCLAGHIAHISELLKLFQHLYPSLKIPQKCEDDKPLVPKFQVSDLKARSLGIKFISLETCLKDTIESLKEKGLYNI